MAPTIIAERSLETAVAVPLAPASSTELSPLLSSSAQPPGPVEIDQTRRCHRGLIFEALPEYPQTAARQFATAPVEGTRPSEHKDPGFVDRMLGKARHTCLRVKENWDRSQVGTWVNEKLSEAQEDFAALRGWLGEQRAHFVESRFGKWAAMALRDPRQAIIEVAQSLRQGFDDAIDSLRESSEKLAERIRGSSAEDRALPPDGGGSRITFASSPQGGDQTSSAAQDDYYSRLQRHEDALLLALEGGRERPGIAEITAEGVLQYASTLREAQGHDHEASDVTAQVRTTEVEGSNREILNDLLADQDLDPGAVLALVSESETDGQKNGAFPGSKHVDAAQIRSLAKRRDRAASTKPEPSAPDQPKLA